MAEGAIETYLETVYKQFQFHASWPPGSLVELGDIGKISDGAFVRTSSLADKGFSFRKEKRDAPSLRFASKGGVAFHGSLSGKANKVVSAIAKLDAGLKIAFKKVGAIVFVMDPAYDESIRDIDSLDEWMRSVRGKALKADQVVVTHVRRAGSGVIAMASTEGAEVQLKTDVSIGKGRLSIADVKGKLELVTSTDTEFVSIPRGRSGTTPLFRMLRYHVPSPWNPFSGKPGTRLARMRQEDLHKVAAPVGLKARDSTRRSGASA